LALAYHSQTYRKFGKQIAIFKKKYKDEVFTIIFDFTFLYVCAGG